MSGKSTASGKSAASEKPALTIFDYGGGNLKSVSAAFRFLGFEAKTTSRPEDITVAQRLVLPGVGAFGECVRALRKTGADTALKRFIKSGRPYLGICLGLHILFEGSEEDPGERGIGVFGGNVERIVPSADFKDNGIKATGIKVPHMGWNRVFFKSDPPGGSPPLFDGIENGQRFYFAHSFRAPSGNGTPVEATANHGGEFAATVRRGSVFACQFHPERSSDAGLQMLKNFALFRTER